jgi:antitoxin component of MazEF toxin-antitoxin module
MKKNSEKNFQSLQIDSLTGDYFIILPEWMVNELSWYEDTEIEVKIEGSDIILTEKTEN